MDDDRLELLFQLLRRPIPWDPLPPWLRLDENILQEFTKIEIAFQQRELELQQEKMREFSRIMGI